MSGQQERSTSNKHKKIKKENAIKTPYSGHTTQKKGSEGVQDKRFARATYDPKFMAPSSKMTKVKIDKRFSKMLNDSSFHTGSSIDRYGRKLTKNQGSELKDYYYMDEEEPEIEQAEEQNAQVFEEEHSNQGIREWMENYNEESSELQDIDIADFEAEDIDEVWSDNSQHVIKGEGIPVTKRLALCNYDWMNISAKDLMILFSSFNKNVGFIKNIKVYMSNFGKEKIEEEQKHGPTGIWKTEEEEAIEPQEKKNGWRKSWKDLLKERAESDNNGFDENKLRRYEKERLKYFYAVIECDSKKTADELYRECDGNQFQNSNVPFDLRFIPDQTQFDPSNLKEECNQVPVAGQVKNFINRSMGHSKISLSWEDPQLSLAASLKKKNWNKLSEAQLDKIDWGAYINQDDIDEEEQMRKMALLGNYQENQEEQADKIADWRKSNNKKYRRNEGDDLEITFQGGFDTKQKKTQSKKQEVPSLNKQRKTMNQRKKAHMEQKQRRREQLQLLVDETTKKEIKVDLNDARFKAVYDNPHFAIDPVDPKFDHRRTGQVFAQVVQRNKNKNNQ